MNYLAHAFLSRENKEILIGNFIADHIRGNNFKGYSEGIIEGILMHRQIDSYTDSHPLFKASKRLFYKGFEKYSGILVDIYFDHLLAKNFEKHHLFKLNEFSAKVYSIYSEFKNQMPEHSVRFLDYVITNNIYVNYSNTKGIETVLKHLSHRISHKVELNHSVPLFINHELELTQNFDAFIIDLKKQFLNPD